MIRVFDSTQRSLPTITVRTRLELARFARAGELLARIFRTTPPRHLRALAESLATDEADIFPIWTRPTARKPGAA